MEIFIALVFIIGWIVGYISGAAYLVKMLNSNTTKDKEWAENLVKRYKKHGTL